jgi:type I restriction-modification system DNA methylase subunit
MSLPQTIRELVDRFKRQREAYRSPQYNETQLRREFLDPFFKTLGWDIDNEQGYAEAYKDVIHEDTIRVGESTKAPDYCFRIGGARKFFLEAKKPAVDIKHDVSPAFQLRRYAWTTKLPLSILSDFEEFAVYDCRVKPDQRDSAAVARVLYIPCTEYAERWDEIASVFSRDAVLKGSFDKFAESNKAKRGTADVDDEFLKTIEDWRAELARNLALRNPKLTQRELNFAVQRIIDRIIFLRICEGRGIEDYGRLRALTNGDRIYPRLAQLFEQADDRFNSGLFHFQREKGRHEAPDELTLGLDLDDKLLRDILKSLYYPECPYVFSALSANILGQVYEQFLGKVIRLTEGHRAVVEEKPEVKKAGGVYYTPAYIVEFIVQQTIGNLVEGKTPKQAAKLKILDPACGSGSFLLGAYEFLLRWHLDCYVKNEPAKWAKGSRPALVQTSGGWRLTIAERKRILLDNLYGVDIDAQAVATTKLSLLLKLLEGETQQSLQPLLRKFQERALPDLSDNIKCGNSLIGPDYYQQPELTLLTQDELDRVNVFDWHAEFPHIFQRATSTGELRETAAASPLDYTMPGVPLHGSYSYKKTKGAKARALPVATESEWEGGFDAVIGNPPYVRQESLSAAKEYFRNHYEAFDGVADLYTYFMEQSVNLLCGGGLFSMIVSSSFLRATYGEPLRRTLKKNTAILRIVDFGGLAVFANAKDTYVCIPLLAKGAKQKRVEVSKVESLGIRKLSEHVAANHFTIPHEQLSPGAWSLKSSAETAVFEKAMKAGQPLGQYVERRFFRGVTSGLNEAFVIDTETKRKLIAKDRRSAELIHPLLGGEDIGRYFFHETGKWLIFTRRGVDIDSYPAIRAHLEKWKEDLTPKSDQSANRGRKPGRYAWYEIQDDVAYYEAFDRPKLIFPDICKGPRFALDTSGSYLANTAYCLGTDDRYLLGFLNSRLFWFAISNISIPFGIRAGEYRYRLICQYMERVPIRVVDVANRADKSSHDQIVKLVEQMLELHQRLAAARTPPEKTSLDRQIAAIDAQIDRLVYELYGLSAEEIRIVEGEK